MAGVLLYLKSMLLIFAATEGMNSCTLAGKLVNRVHSGVGRGVKPVLYNLCKLFNEID